MPFTLEAFKARRPFLYHFTAAENVERLKSTRELTSATKLASGVTTLSDKREKAVAVVANGETAWLQTQKPLHKANIAFEGGWQMRDFINCLNSQVFSGLGRSWDQRSMGFATLRETNGPRIPLPFDSKSQMYPRHSYSAPTIQVLRDTHMERHLPAARTLFLQPTNFVEHSAMLLRW